MKFSSYLNTDYIFPNLEANSKEEIIRKIVNKVAEDDRAVGEQKDEIIKKYFKKRRRNFYLYRWRNFLTTYKNDRFFRFYYSSCNC